MSRLPCLVRPLSFSLRLLTLCSVAGYAIKRPKRAIDEVAVNEPSVTKKRFRVSDIKDTRSFSDFQRS